MIGRSVGPYLIVEKIGEGGMAEVFRARDDRLSRDVAVKVIRASFEDHDRVRRFEFEARAAAALNHPNIVVVYDVGVYEGARPYIVQELLVGQTLRRQLFEGPLPPKQAGEFALQITHGLIAAHEKNIIHRDLKPENLFVTKDGRIKILDFGIAKLSAPRTATDDTLALDLATQTKLGVVIGTAAYMSPEHLRGKPVDYRTDIFSFGAIFYEMLSGKRAFRGESDADTITAVLREDPTALTELRPTIPAAFEPVVAHCLEKDPENRFQTARDLAFALNTAIHSGAMTAPVRKAPVASSNRYVRWMIAAAAILTGLTAGLLAAHFWQRSPVVYQRLTFESGTVYGARFVPGERNILYDASWNGRRPQLFTSSSDAPQEQPHSYSSAHLLAVSSTHTLALQLNGKSGSRFEFEGGTVSLLPPGGTPRDLMEDVRWADWDSHDKLAVVHYQEGRSRLEYPPGNVLFQTAGWISHIRISPDGNQVAFVHHPALWDDRGLIMVVDGQKQVRALTGDWGSAAGLAWQPAGNEVWFTAVDKGYNRVLQAVNLSGKRRTILSVPGGLTLQDIAADGRVLLNVDDERLAMESSTREGKNVQNLSWYNWTVPKDLSRDGQWVLFEDASEPAGDNYAVGLRKLDGSPPIRLGDGSAGSLSPDGKWALAVFTGANPHVTLIPTGAGQARDVFIPSLERLQSGYASMFPDGQHLLVSGNQKDKPRRSYIVDMNGGSARPVTPEGVVGRLISPDGRYVAALGVEREVKLYPVDGGDAVSIPALEPGFTAAQWSTDGKSLLMYRGRELPATIYEVSIATGARKQVRTITPLDPVFAQWVAPIVTNQDASRFVYGYYERRSTLYTISGLK